MSGINYLKIRNRWYSFSRKYDFDEWRYLSTLCLVFQGYLDAAEQEREKYLQEMAAYKQTEAYKQFNEHKQKKKSKPSTTTDDVSMSIYQM